MKLRHLPGISVYAAFILLLSLSCADNSSPLEPIDNSRPNQSGSMFLGAWALVPSPDLKSAEITPIRTPQLDVTQWAEIAILDTEWDEVLRTWTVTVEIKNPTPLSGWGVRAIFTELGDKQMRWPDGFTWIDLDTVPSDERYPFFAIEKTTPDRIFEGLHVSTGEFTFHFPEGTDKWAPLSFFLDANIGEPRPDPMVEDMNMAYFPPPCYHSTVLARVGDHQSSGDDLFVWTDLSKVGGSAQEQLFDDGLHDDGEAGDGIFGAKFSDGNFGELYKFTVIAQDPEGNTGENDITYSPIMYPPLPPIGFEEIQKGQFSLLFSERFEVITDQASWDQFWTEFSIDDVPPPPVDFVTKNVVVACLGQRDNDCYHAEITGIDWSSSNCGWNVSYKETIPGPDCKCAEIPTSPYHLVMVNKASFDVMFTPEIYLDDCSVITDPCLDILPLADGTHGQAMDQSMSVIRTQLDWESWWASSVGASEPPMVDFDNDMLIAVNMGVRNTSGYYPTIDSACTDDTGMLEITVGWHSPDSDCIVLMVITWPYVVVRVEKTELPYYFTTYDDVYSCK